MGVLITADTWSDLEKVRPDAHGIVRRRIAPDAPVDIFVAVEMPSNTRLVTIAFRGGGMPDLDRVAPTRGIDIVPIPSATGPGSTGLTLRLASTRFVDVFTVLADDLAGVAASGLAPAVGLEAVTSRLRRWEAFLELADDEGMGDERRAGLFGELHVLGIKLLPAMTPSAAVDSWRGPLNAVQDFQGASWAVEVKTSRMREPAALRITSERQLDDRGLDQLFLAHIALEQRHRSGQTLPELVAAVRSELDLDAAARETFEERLIRAGYLDAQAPLYEDSGYTVREAAVFRVRDGFPRILFDDLDAGVGDVHYSVAVAGCRPFAVTWNEVTSAAGE